MIINSTTIQALRSELAAAHAAIEAKYGVKISLGSSKYTDSHIEMKMTVGNLGSDGKAEDRASVYLKANFRLIGLSQADLDKVINISGMSVKIVGYNTRKRLRPFVIRHVHTGKEYITSETSVKQALFHHSTRA